MNFFSNMKLATKLLATVVAVFVLLCASVYISIHQAEDKVITQQAESIAQTVSTRVEAIREVYTKYVAGKLHQDLPDQVKAVVSPSGKGEIPLPATFVHLVGDQAEKGENLATYDLISGWNINAKKGLRDDFEREAWKSLVMQQEALKQQAKDEGKDYATLLAGHQWKPFFRRENDEHGAEVFRYMMADVAAAPACVQCHNELEQHQDILSLRRSEGFDQIKQFQLNEVMGAVTVTVPIAAAGATAQKAINTVLGVFLALSVLALLAIFYVIRSSTRRIQKLTEATNKIVKEGDLTQKIEVDSNDELGQMAATFQQMVKKLAEIPLVVQGASKNLASAAAEIYAAAQEHESAAQQQSGAGEEVSRTVQSLLESAAHVSDSSQGVLANAERAKETSDLTSKKIAELSAHTSRMSELLDVIREIADRSDLLALNASLEGTRAGEAGRGFSLVAAEMRRLAERVGKSAQDVKALVTDVRNSSASTVLVTEEARKLAESTMESARQISLVTQQQKTATAQVADSMKNISQVLAQSSAASRQTRAAVEDLKTQAEKLTEVVGRFRFEAEAKQ